MASHTGFEFPSSKYLSCIVICIVICIVKFIVNIIRVLIDSVNLSHKFELCIYSVCRHVYPQILSVLV